MSIKSCIGKLMGAPKVLAAVVVFFLLSGCAVRMVTGIFVAEKDNYLAAETVPELNIPPDLDSSNIQDAWVIPTIPDQPAARTYPAGAPKPATIVGENDPNTIRIKRLGERRWMVLQRNPETVWPLVRQFLRYYSMSVEAERPEDGEITTGELDFEPGAMDPELLDLIRENLPSAANGDYMVFRIEQGIRRGTSEIHMRYLGPDQEPYPTMWLDGNAETGELEGKLLTAVAEFDVSELSESTISSIARQIATEAKASVVRDDAGYPVLNINVDFERAWASISKALESASIEVAEANRDEQVFQIVLPRLESESQKRKRGFMGFIFGGRKANQAKDPEALIRIEQQGSAYTVSVTRVDGENVEVDYAEQFLAMLREHAA